MGSSGGINIDWIRQICRQRVSSSRIWGSEKFSKNVILLLLMIIYKKYAQIIQRCFIPCLILNVKTSRREVIVICEFEFTRYMTLLLHRFTINF